MTELNLDGLPALKALRSQGLGGDSFAASVFGELRELVKRERQDEGSHNCDECYNNGLEDGTERLPAWAKPVMSVLSKMAEPEPGKAPIHYLEELLDLLPTVALLLAEQRGLA